MKIKQIPILTDVDSHKKLKELARKTRVPMQVYLREALAWLLKKYEA